MTAYNNFSESIVQFNQITGAYINLVLLPTSPIYHHIEIDSTLDQEVILIFPGNNIITVPKGEIIVRDEFKIGGQVQIKYTGSLGSSGSISVVCW